MNRRTFLSGAALAGASATLGAAGGYWYGSRRLEWRQVSAGAGFDKRDAAYGFQHDGKLWLAGGYMLGAVPRRDLWASKDAVDWQMVSKETPYPGFSPVTAHLGEIVAYHSSLWRSPDGVDWRQEPSTGEVPPPGWEVPMISFEERLVMVYQESVYVCEDGRWSNFALPWEFRGSPGAAVFNNRLFVAGGAFRGEMTPPARGYAELTAQNDVWSTNDPTDPSAWVQHTGRAPWLPRMWPVIIPHDGYLYLTSGYDAAAARNLNDTWRTRDGVSWDVVATERNYPPRHAPTVFSSNGRLVLVAGNTNRRTSVQNDIWELS